MKQQARTAANTAHRIDRKLSHEAGKIREAPAVRIAAAIGEVADQPPLIAVSAATIVLGAALRRPAVMRTGARMLASHLLATGIKTIIKHRIDRTRPKAAQEGDDYTLATGGSREHDLSSFPSGHTAGAVAVARAIARDVPESATFGVIGAGAVAAIQLPSASHYASDVAAGAVIGVVSEWIVAGAFSLTEREIERLTAPHRD